MSSHNDHPATIAGGPDSSAHHEHDLSKDVGLYRRTLLTLLVLTAITVGAAGIQFGSGAANIVIALTIATIKATLVALFFMHLAHDKPVNAIIASAGFIFLGIFLMFDFLDVGTRVNLQPHNMPAMAQPTPTPSTLNLLLEPPPQPPAPPKTAPANSGGEGAPELK
jgi:cytochrome c oxidase subunit IV